MIPPHCLLLSKILLAFLVFNRWCNSSSVEYMQEYISENFDAEKLYKLLIYDGSGSGSVEPSEPAQPSLNSVNPEVPIKSPYGADRFLPAIDIDDDFDFSFNLSALELYPNPTPEDDVPVPVLFSLPPVIPVLILNYLTAKELIPIFCLSKAFNRLVIAVFNWKNPFPFIPIPSMSCFQIDNLQIAAKLLNRIHPSLHLNGVENVKEIGCLLQMSRKTCYTATDAETISLSLTDPKNRDLLNFINLFNPQNRTSDRDGEIIQIIRDILTNNYCTSFDVLVRLIIFKFKNVSLLSSFFIDEFMTCKCVYIIRTLFSLLVNIRFHEEGFREIALSSVRFNNGTIMRVFLEHYTPTDETFLKNVFDSIFVHDSTDSFQAMIECNLVMLSFLLKNPHLSKLPEDYFDAHVDSNGFLKAYIASPLGYSLSTNTNNNTVDNLLLRSLSNRWSASYFIQLVNDENYQITSDLLYEIVHTLSIQVTDFAYHSIIAFWNSSKIYNLFSELTSHKRVAIFDKIFKERNYFHLLALAECNFDYYNDLLSDFISCHSDRTRDLILEEDFFLQEVAPENILFVKKFVQSKAFTANFRFHPQYLYNALKYKKYIMFIVMLESDSLSMSSSDFKDIIFAFKETIGGEERYFSAFWTSKASHKAFDRLGDIVIVEFIKDLITSQHYNQISSLLTYKFSTEIPFNPIEFDLIGFCLEKKVKTEIVKHFWNCKHFKNRFPISYRKHYISSYFKSLLDNVG